MHNKTNGNSTFETNRDAAVVQIRLTEEGELKIDEWGDAEAAWRFLRQSDFWMKFVSK
ncbi:hypothetical protein [Chromobacterium haemolyticum]|uniref:hypothetical protein n=1 Tax=Chromobacterium haemolyticum TaxID=394935 RepID=UPI0015C4A61A|nr:hypothetical protein [Chromobacterium haemolyticum]